MPEQGCRQEGATMIDRLREVVQQAERLTEEEQEWLAAFWEEQLEEAR
jgi:hypothetical protein